MLTPRSLPGLPPRSRKALRGGRAILALCVLGSPADAGQRTTRDLEVLYRFDEGSGDVVHDTSGAVPPLHLRIESPDEVRWEDGHLSVRSPATILSQEPATRLAESVKRSGAITIEAWLRPRGTGQEGPARIVSLSANPRRRDFTLGQDGDRYDVRLRSTSTGRNGVPSVATPPGSLQAERTHLVYTRRASGEVRIYLDGKRAAAGTVEGDLSNWLGGFRLSLANEVTGDRPWVGDLHLAAVYSRALAEDEVRQNFAAGPDRPVLESAAVTEAVASGAGRARRGLRLLYTFASGEGATVADRSGVGTPLDLVVEDEAAIERRPGVLRIRSPTTIRSSGPAPKLVEAVQRSGSLSIEAWVRPEDVDQDGPARIVSLSGSSVERDFTLGQKGDRFDVRLRTTGTSDNGIPSLSTPEGTLEAERTHVVYTRDAAGSARLFVDGRQRAARRVEGYLDNWNGEFPLLLGNELTGERSWSGELHLVAVYSRALSASEVARNFLVGSDFDGSYTRPRALVDVASTEATARPDPEAAGDAPAEPGSRRYFEAHVAPLFRQRCIECHGPAKQKGRLDLTTRAAAFEGGRHGEVIVPGDAEDSILWEQVEHDEMPKRGPPLSDAEKEHVREWIAAGAAWPADRVALSRSGGDEPIETHREFECSSEVRDPGPALLRRLTVPEYIETVRSAAGVDVERKARQTLPPDVRADGFRNTAYNLTVDLGHVGAYAELARLIVRRMDVLEFAGEHASCRTLDEACMTEVIRGMGKWLLRGPLEPQETAAFLEISTAVADAGGDFREAVSYILEAMLQSPRFIYRIEDQRGDGSVRRVGGYELASRLSYILWGGPPDEELLRAAGAGELSGHSAVAAQVRRMLEDPRAIERSSRFIHEWLDLSRLSNLRPDPERFPRWSERLAADMRRETLEFFEEVAWEQERPLADLMNAQVTYATPRLAELYGLEPKGKDLVRYDVSSVPARGGLLTQGSVLTVGGDEASMVSRGLFVLHNILSSEVDDPPPGVDTTPVPTEPGLSQRAISEERIADPACGGCHSRFEPLAFGLEKFDGIGAHRETDEHGNELREDGEILFPGEDDPVAYRSSSELMDLLAGSERMRETLTLKVTQFALGRPLVETDACMLREIHETAQENGGTYAALITAIAMSDLVHSTRTEAIR